MSIPQNFTAWVVRRIATEGIFRVEGFSCVPGQLVVPRADGTADVYTRAAEWARTPEEARRKARAIVDRRKAALRKLIATTSQQIRRLENLTFEVEGEEPNQNAA